VIDYLLVKFSTLLRISERNFGDNRDFRCPRLKKCPKLTFLSHFFHGAYWRTPIGRCAGVTPTLCCKIARMS